MCLRKSILAIWLINGKAFVSASPPGAHVFFFSRDIKQAEVAFSQESQAAVVKVQPVAGRVMRRVAVLFSFSNMKDPDL